MSSSSSRSCSKSGSDLLVVNLGVDLFKVNLAVNLEVDLFAANLVVNLEVDLVDNL